MERKLLVTDGFMLLKMMVPRTVGQGFSQIPGKDFQENHAPVVHDTTFRFFLLIHKLSSGQFDVVTAFLYGELDEIIYMNFPYGYSQFLQEKYQLVYSSTDHCLLLEKALYGLFQAARQWWKRVNEFMKKLRFFPSPADPCLFVKIGTKDDPPAFIIIYVDDGLIIGTSDLIKTVLKALAKEFKIKDLGPIKIFVGCKIVINRERDTIWINQPNLIQNFEMNFRTLVTTDRVFNTGSTQIRCHATCKRCRSNNRCR
jgi:Reverse transcriptase (RNA-dependent DNA polymerase)